MRLAPLIKALLRQKLTASQRYMYLQYYETERLYIVGKLLDLIISRETIRPWFNGFHPGCI